MFKVVAFLVAFLSAVSAFAPSASARSRSTNVLMKSQFADAVGAQAPLGFFDPLGLLLDADQERFDRLREVEVKHGRVAMLAVLGHIITTKGDRIPGDIAYGVPFSSVKSGLAAFETIPLAGIAQIFFFIGLMELGYSTVKDDVEAFCKKEMVTAGWSESVQRSKMAIELNNGRAAQMGILGLMVHEKLDNNPYVLNSMLGFPVHFN